SGFDVVDQAGRKVELIVLYPIVALPTGDGLVAVGPRQLETAGGVAEQRRQQLLARGPDPGKPVVDLNLDLRHDSSFPGTTLSEFQKTRQPRTSRPTLGERAVTGTIDALGSVPLLQLPKELIS